MAHHQVRNIVIRTIFTGVDLDEREENYDRRQRPKLYESYAWRIGDTEAVEVRYHRSHREAISGHLQLLKSTKSRFPMLMLLQLRTQILATDDWRGVSVS